MPSMPFDIPLGLFCIALLLGCLLRIPSTVYALSKRSHLFPSHQRGLLRAQHDDVDSESLLERLRLQFTCLTQVDSHASGVQHYAEKNQWAQFGHYFAHVGMLVALLGIVSSTDGIHHTFYIEPGETRTGLLLPTATGDEQPLPFEIRCDDAQTVYHDDTSRVLKHLSTISILRSGEVLATKQVAFGDPLQFEGYSIYQDRHAGLKVISDGGSQLPWPGLFLMLLGFCISFLFPHSRVWLQLETSGGRTRATILGAATRDSKLFEEFLVGLARGRNG